MSAVLSIDRNASALKLNPVPTQKYWFDPIPPRTSVQAERRHRQERLAGAFRLFARFGFAQGLAGHITAAIPSWPTTSGSTRWASTSRASRSPTCCWSMPGARP